MLKIGCTLPLSVVAFAAGTMITSALSFPLPLTALIKVAPAPAPVTVAQATTDKGKPPKDGSKPGWGNGDPNHDHTGPPGKESKNQATSPGLPEPAAAASDQHGSDQNGEKKSTVR